MTWILLDGELIPLHRDLACTGASAEHKTIRDVAITTAVDIMSDLLVLSLPISILWKVRISVRQKIGLAFSLCLSCVMIIVAIVRVAGMVRGGGGSVDIVWVACWQHQECSIAIIMVSVSAFRSLFIPSPTNHLVQKHQGYSPSERRRKFLRRRPDPDLYDTHETGGLPQIPSATFTGTAIMVGEDGYSEERAGLDRQLRDHLPPSGDGFEEAILEPDYIQRVAQIWDKYQIGARRNREPCD